MQGENWTTVIKPKTGWFDINLKELIQYKDLIVMFVKRDFKTLYKQTILGPLWLIISPLLTTLMFTVVFGNIANISTDGMPQIVFYMLGTTVWTYFSSCLTKTSSTFTGNAAIFGKVYFPRLVTPISTVISGLINFSVQFLMFLGFMGYFMIKGSPIHPNLYILMTPFLLVQLAALALGFGIIISSLTTKYRDLAVLVTFGVQLWMYATPVVYPASQISGKLKTLMMLNPVSPIVETFRYAFLGSGSIPWNYLGISVITTLVVLFVGVVLFSRVEKTFMDTV
ncbi:MAG: ABC transporter permease [Terrisporobacter othiniensis]|uniref:Transport permease protein n=1 Tax=Terrisporobacter othiniensis TaxID=1577792 RepID=A0A0B3VYL7_9FIRM|nr:ABC transporter permease [Terrisporobacter othiniensis]KHS57834.1 ABC transporter permease [Terrisporobacter othiniensis]MDY3373020.1 ABC transporter permease [Terrisporobacter othiniensis]